MNLGVWTRCSKRCRTTGENDQRQFESGTVSIEGVMLTLGGEN
jgi:hypothetical protein